MKKAITFRSILAAIAFVGMIVSMRVYFNDFGRVSTLLVASTWLASLVVLTVSMMSIEEILKSNKR